MKFVKKVTFLILFLFSMNLIMPSLNVQAFEDLNTKEINVNENLELILDEKVNEEKTESVNLNDGGSEASKVNEKAVNISDEPVLIKLENPIENHKLTGSFFVKGWAIGLENISGVSVYVDGALYGQANYGIERNDIGSKYPQYSNSNISGFNMEITGYKNGTHQVKVVATDIKGQKAEAKVNINVDTTTTAIMSQGTLRREQLISYLLKRNPTKSQEYVENFVDYTINEANIEGVNYDILFSQMMHETGFLKFGGDVKEEQNNFAGLGAVGNGAPGESFPTIEIGIRAVTQHLKAYASSKPLVQVCVDTRFKYVQRGTALYVEHLGIPENPKGKGWAAANAYGYKILKIIDEIKQEPVTYVSKVISFETTGEAVAGSKMTMIATATPEADTEYRFLVRDPSGYWKGLNDYSSKNSIEYTPTMSGMYRYVVHVKHKNSSADYDELKVIDFYVSGATSKITSFETTGEAVAGSKMTMIATATPEADTEYRFLVRDPSGYWKGLNDYSSKNSIEYTPTMSGMYRYVVHVKHKNSSADYDELKVIDFYVSGATSKITSFETTGEAVAGSKMTMIATATPEADTEYRFLVRDPSGYWKGLNDYSSKNSIEYTPTMSGMYRYVVHVKHKNSSADYDELKVIDFYVSGATSKITSFETTGEAVAGSKMTMIATATPEADTEYRFLVRDPSGYWKGLNDYSSKNSIEYTPTMSGMYRYVVHVKHKNSSADYDELKVIDFYVSGATSKITSFETTGEAVAGSKMTMIATATPEADTEYRFLVRDPSGYWKGLNDYSSKNSIEYTPTMSGMYRYVVHVKHKNSSADYDELKVIDFYVSGATSKITSFETTGEAVAGSKMTMIATATPEADTEYRFLVRDPSGYWKGLNDYSSKNSIEYTPTMSGMYRYVVHVKHKNSSADYDELKVIDLYIDSNLIVIDPGHNYGGDDGAYATHNGITYIERDLNMEFSLKLKSELEKRGFRVVLTRNPEDRETLSESASLKKRVDLANNLNANLFISIHQNSYTSSSVNGFEVYYSDAMPGSRGLLSSGGIEYSPSGFIRSAESEKVKISKKIGSSIVNSVTSEMGIKNRGLKNKELYVVKNTTMPSLLLECGFISNPDEAKNLANSQKQQKMAEIIAREIDKNL